MPVPKRRHSRSRSRKRRTHWKLDPPNASLCAHCHQPIVPHRVCPYCGYYKGREVVIKEAKK